MLKTTVVISLIFLALHAQDVDLLTSCEEQFIDAAERQRSICASDGNVYANLQVAQCVDGANVQLFACTSGYPLRFCRHTCVVEVTLMENEQTPADWR